MSDSTKADSSARMPSAQHAIISLLNIIHRSTERLNDCLGAVVAAQQGRLAEDLINPVTFTRDIAEIGYGEAVHHLQLLNQLCECLHIDGMALSKIPDQPHSIRIEYH